MVTSGYKVAVIADYASGGSVLVGVCAGTGVYEVGVCGVYEVVMAACSVYESARG